MRSKWLKLLFIPPVLLLLCIGVYFLPPVNSRLAWRVSEVQARIHDYFAPPEKEIFRPQETTVIQDHIATMVQETLAALTPSATACPGNDCSTPTAIPTHATIASTATPAPTATLATPTITPTAIPGKATLQGIVHEFQQWNNCGPANLAMALSFWKWKGTQVETAAYLKPNPRDKNVMPYEMLGFVQDKTNLRALERMGGDLNLLKRLLAAGYPVIVEKGFEGVNFEGWMGHYEVISGYDDAKNAFTVQDSFLGPNLAVSYPEMEDYWRAFNYLFIVVYPPQREADLLSVLGPLADLKAAVQAAAQKASTEIGTLTGRDQYFAYFNRGTSLENLLDYAGAAAAYDKAFAIYPTIAEKQRPYRMVWYQTGVYFAYFFTGRYNDVINLATQAIGSTTEPGIEESWTWRARARAAQGDTAGAVDDLRTALKWHPGFTAALDELKILGATP